MERITFRNWGWEDEKAGNQSSDSKLGNMWKILRAQERRELAMLITKD